MFTLVSKELFELDPATEKAEQI